jgi:hypothetical protein
LVASSPVSHRALSSAVTAVGLSSIKEVRSRKISD